MIDAEIWRGESGREREASRTEERRRGDKRRRRIRCTGVFYDFISFRGERIALRSGKSSSVTIDKPKRALFPFPSLFFSSASS